MVIISLANYLNQSGAFCSIESSAKASSLSAAILSLSFSIFASSVSQSPPSSPTIKNYLGLKGFLILLNADFRFINTSLVSFSENSFPFYFLIFLKIFIIFFSSASVKSSPPINLSYKSLSVLVSLNSNYFMHSFLFECSDFS